LMMASMDGFGQNRAWEWETMRRLAHEVMPTLRKATSKPVAALLAA
jgi:hypothetical protein